jgi:serine/threonine protein kinase
VGEVYRADDLQLGQPVALKFLPESIAQDEAQLDQLRSEVRLARQISHPNICRIYDISVAEGLPFLSMEFVDGEDLESLLKQIGRFPGEKGLEISKQICGGLHAAHRQGIIHRDLKPANVMIDENGQVRITDFGLAHSTQDQRVGGISGTPAYMAPEQLRGEELTPAADIYALGLVLFEIFSGQAPEEILSIQDALQKKRSSNSNATLRSVVRDIDPVLDNVIGLCLRTDPTERPESTLEILEALPGNSPLETVMAMGYTPSPQQVAASESRGVIGVGPLVALSATALALLAGVYVVAIPSSMIPQSGMDDSPEIMANRAREMLDDLEVPRYDHSARGIWLNDQAAYATQDPGSRLPSHAEWARSVKEFYSLEQPAMSFAWYRESRTPLRPSPRYTNRRTNNQFPRFFAELNNPSLSQVDSVAVVTNPGGTLHLLRWELTAASVQALEPSQRSVDKSVALLFEKAGLDVGQFQSVTGSSD